MAARNVSFYGPSRGPIGGQRSDPRMRMAQQLMQQGASTAPVQSPLEGITRALTAGVGGYFGGKSRDEAEAKKAQYAADMMKVLQGGMATPGTPAVQGRPQGGHPGLMDVPAVEAQPAVPGKPGGTSGMLAALGQTGNPDLADTGMQLAMQQIQQQQQARSAAAARQQQLSDFETQRTAGLEDYRTKAGIDAEFKAPPVDKYGSPYVIKDPNSSTGYSRFRSNQAGDDDYLGEAPAPRQMFDVEGPRKTAKYKATSGRYEDATNQINEADTVLGDVQQMMGLIDRVDSGTFADTILSMKKVGAAAGFDMDMTSIANAEAMKAKGMDFVLQRIAKTKGAISEKEMVAFEAASAGIKNTPEGNRMILDLATKVSSRMKAEAEAVREAYGSNPDISVKELDDIRFKTRKGFGSLVPGGSKGDGIKDFDPVELENLLNKYPGKG